MIPLIRRIAVAVVGVASLCAAHSTLRNPLSYVSLIEDLTIHASNSHVHAYSNFDISFLLHGKQKVRLSLEPNHDVIHDTLQITYLNPDGSLKAVEPVERTDFRVFKGDAFVRHEGHTEWTNAGWARIFVHRDGKRPLFEGAFRIDGDHHHVQTVSEYRKLKHEEDPDVDAENGDETMVVWRDSDIIPHWSPAGEGHDELKRDIYGRTSCSTDDLGYNAQYRPLVPRDVSPLRSVSARDLFGRQIDGTTGNNGAGVDLLSHIGSTFGCPSTRKVALVGIAADCTYMSDFANDQDARANIIKQINAASQVYESTFNISLGIQNLTIVDKACPTSAPASAPWNIGCSNDVSITDRLNLFSAWRGLSRDTNAYWTLLSKCNTGAAVGLAWLGQVCSKEAIQNNQAGANETIASANVVIRTPTEWQVIAHETGHTFGAVHDCTGNSCGSQDDRFQRCCPLSRDSCDAGGQFIMNPSTGSGIKAFSPCSIGNICSAMAVGGAVNANCLTNNKDVTTITGSQCGNGIVETGEDCDCGGEQGCEDNPCCDAKTCKFKNGATCDPSNEDCCTNECQISSRGTVCRPSTGFCDPEEVCDGELAMCPQDSFQKDLTDCGNGLQCASGQCTSRDLQCRTMMGGLTNSNNTFACKDRTSNPCLLACESDQFRGGQCITMNQNFLDGTPCGGGGTCGNGMCKGASITGEVGEWLRENKNIVIPVASVVGGLILLALVSCLVGHIKKRKARKRRQNRPPKPSPMGSWASYGGSFSPGGIPPTQRQQPPPQQQQPQPQQSQQQQRSLQDRPLPMPPPAAQGPPPSYSPYQPQWGVQGRSMRYA